MTYTLLEEQFFPYPWCQRLLRGLNEEARKKRIEITQLTNLEEKPSEFGCVLLIGATSSWVNTMAEKARTVGLHPIVMTNRQPGASPFPFSSVMMDIQGSMQLAVQYLHALGRDRLALYGVNPLAASDPWRAECFALLTGKPDDVFVCGDSFEALYERFRAVIENYDSVICASDYAAISLVRRLQQDGYPIPEKLYLISYGNMALSQLMRPSITSISDGYEEFGRAALSISSLIEKNPSISTVNIQLHCQLNIRETTENRPLPVSAEDAAAEPVLENRFFKDPEISNLARLETLFQQCDEIDMALIQQLLSGDSYAQMTEKSFISETAVKYRIRKMEKTCGVGTRMELVRFLKDFLERS